MFKEQQASCLEIMVDRLRKREGKIEILTKTITKVIWMLYHEEYGWYAVFDGYMEIMLLCICLVSCVLGGLLIGCVLMFGSDRTCNAALQKISWPCLMIINDRLWCNVYNSLDVYYGIS